MKFLICANSQSIHKQRSLSIWKYLRSLGHTVWIETSGYLLGEYPDVIISMSISLMEDTYRFVERFPNTHLYCYNWDCYEWVWSNPRSNECNYKRYGELLRHATEIWVPSKCTGIRVKQWWGLNNWKVVLSGCHYWDSDTKDDGYALCCLREIPDSFWGKFEQACEELAIPYQMTLHKANLADYQKAVANCSFLCAPLYELSTGGLSLLEGYYLGKPCLVSDSEWNGSRDYLGDRAVYFKHDDWEDFKSKLCYTYKLSSVPKDYAEYVRNKFTWERMLDRMLERVYETSHSHITST